MFNIYLRGSLFSDGVTTTICYLGLDCRFAKPNGSIKRSRLLAADMVSLLFRLCITQLAGLNIYGGRLTLVDDSDTLQILGFQEKLYKQGERYVNVSTSVFHKYM